MPRKKKRSAAQLEAAARGTQSTKKIKVKRRSGEILEELYQSQIRDRKKELTSAMRGRGTSLAVLLMLFLMIINVQIQDGLGRWESVTKIAGYSNKSPYRLSVKFNHYVKTGNVLVQDS